MNSAAFKWSLIVLNILLIGYFTTKELMPSQSGKIAYVRSHDLVYQYLGMKEAQNKFELQKQEWQANIDTLKADYQKSLQHFQENMNTLSDQQKTEQQSLIEVQYNNVFQYAENLNRKVDQEHDKILQGVLNQVNSYAHKYAEEHGYTLILGTTLSGSILYGESAIDITEKLLTKMNQDYK